MIIPKKFLHQLILKKIAMSLFFILVTTIFLQAQPHGVKDPSGKWAVADRAGKVITPYLYTNSQLKFQEDLAVVFIGKKSGVIDTTGKIVVPLIYTECEAFNNGTSSVWIGEKCGLIDKTGKVLIPIGKYGTIYNYWDPAVIGVTSLSLYDPESTNPNIEKYGLLTNTGEVILDMKYAIDPVRERAMKVTQAGKVGFYIIDSKLFIPRKYDDATYFSEGLAAVCINKKWGFINKKGELVINLYYDSVTPFKNGKSYARGSGVSETLEIPAGK